MQFNMSLSSNPRGWDLSDLSKCDVGTVPKPVGIILASNTASAECNKNEPVAQFAKGSVGDAACPAGYERIVAQGTYEGAP